MSPQLPTVMLRAQSDERLARAAALGNERAFEAIVERYRRPLLVYARRMLGDSARAEDVVQAGLLGAWRQLQDGNEIRDLRAWLYRVVHNGSINLMKRSSSGDLPLLDGAPLAGPALQDQVEQREAVRAALGEIAALPEQQRTALLGVCVQGRRQRDISEEMGVSEGAVRMLVHRARSTVRTAAAALSPWPLLSRLLHVSPSAGLSGGAGGAGLIAGGAAKTVALICTAGVLATAGPSTVHAISDVVSPARQATPPAAQLASAPTAGLPATMAPASSADRGSLTLSRDARPPAVGTALPQLQSAADRSATSVPSSEEHAGGPQEVASAPVELPGAPAATVAGSGPPSALPAPVIAQAPATQAPVDDDEIAVTEEQADTSAGEQAIGSDGVPDQYIPPDTAADQQAIIGSDPPDDPAMPAIGAGAPVADTSTGDPATDAGAPASPVATSP